MMTWTAHSACDACSPVDGRVDFKDLPFRERVDLLMGSHEGIWLNRCAVCGRRWLHLWVEIFDDGWAHWAPVTEVEYDAFAAMDTQENGFEMVEQAKEIVRRDETLQRHPLYGLRWIEGVYAMLDGPPW